ncbi:MAG: nucleotidyltransferase family protein [Minisyncoccia bacterium]
MKVEEIKQKAIPILKASGVTRSSLFGSYARGEEREDSDIDMLVEVPHGTSLFDLIGLQHELERALNKKVDLGTYTSINKYVRNTILEEQLPIYDER